MFTSATADQRLDPSDAMFVDVLHTDMNCESINVHFPSTTSLSEASKPTLNLWNRWFFRPSSVRAERSSRSHRLLRQRGSRPTRVSENHLRRYARHLFLELIRLQSLTRTQT